MTFDGFNTYVLNSGRRLQATADGVLGLMPHDENLVLTTGYDRRWYDDYDEPLMPAERREIAEYMAAAWARWAAQADD